jgi:hypothetical protein
MLWVVGIGTLSFTLAVSRILRAEAKRRLDLHSLHAEAIGMRNRYTRYVLAINEQAHVDAQTIPPAEPVVSARAAA